MNNGSSVQTSTQQAAAMIMRGPDLANKMGPMLGGTHNPIHNNPSK